jgi:hypothetical protein
VDDVVPVSSWTDWSTDLIHTQEQVFFDKDTRVTGFIVPVKMALDLDDSLQYLELEVRHVKQVKLSNFQIVHLLDQDLAALIN